MGINSHINYDKNKVLLQLLQVNQFIIDNLVKRISVIEEKNNIKQSNKDDQMIKDLMLLYNERRDLITKLIYIDEK